MGKAIMGIGIPGSGKTTTLKAFADKNKYIYICPDDIRTELTGNPNDQKRNKEVWEITRQRASDALGLGKTIVIDATFAHFEQRKQFLEFIRSEGVQKIEGLYVDTPFEKAKERNINRKRNVPEFVLERMYDSLEGNSPEISDGFDTLFVLDENREMLSIEVKNRDGEIFRKEFQMKIK